jgi:hypothetical protein
MTGMDVESGLEPDQQPDLDQFLLARIAEDKRIAADAAAAGGRAEWDVEAGAGKPPTAEPLVAKRRLVMACRDSRPDLRFLGARPHGMADFPLTPGDQHQLAALTLALLAQPYAEHHDYRPEWRP